MPVKDYHKILGVLPGATEKQIKTAYRKLAMKYHPDLNQDPGAQEKFFEIDAAYDFSTKHGSTVSARDSYDDTMARKVYRKERERMHQQARARKAKKEREEEMFNRPEWHDPILLVKYIIHGFGLLFALAAIIGPVLIAIFDDPASLAGTFFFYHCRGGVAILYLPKKGKHGSAWGSLRPAGKKWQPSLRWTGKNPAKIAVVTVRVRWLEESPTG